ncbi:hypothetical protein WA026_015097 [Henosepilachna vigintioctopunctata]|uniref:Regulatory protein zeste n=1 Tax=Henosepilachna vigintioctopunctata TaxID=420089 RepID=A0AAW1U893_9CUCU
MNAKKEAWETLRSDYCGVLGKQVTVGQHIKALNNVKFTAKKKTDVKVTENRKIKLKPWEKTFVELIEDDNQYSIKSRVIFQLTQVPGPQLSNRPVMTSEKFCRIQKLKGNKKN